MFANQLLIISSLALIIAALVPRSVQHPLDPLTGEEIEKASRIFKLFRPGKWGISLVLLQEPEKQSILDFFLNDVDPPEGTIPRKAFISAYEHELRAGFEAVVDIELQTVEGFRQLEEGVQPKHTLAEEGLGRAVAYANETVLARCAELGYTDMARVHSDAWYSGYVDDLEQYRGKRLLVYFMFGSSFEGDNFYAHPFDFNVVVDLDEMQVIGIDNLPTHADFDGDNREGNEVPQKNLNYDPRLFDDDFFRQDLRPVVVTQPSGSSITVNGNGISWQKYKMRLGFNAREGFVIHHVNYNDSGTVRPLFYRMSVAELFVPYGDPRPPHHRKHAYDVGEYGLGMSLVELEKGVDCLGEPIFFDAVHNDENGDPQVITNAACVTEEDAGILWKHYDIKNDRMSTTRSQRLSISFTANVDNYDYILMWNFYQDGTVEFQAKLSGILNANLVAVNATPGSYGSMVAEQIQAQYHQHFFSIRIDPEIDGTLNSVVMQEAVAKEEGTGSPENPHGNGIHAELIPLLTAAQAKTNIDPSRARSWIIRNDNNLHPSSKHPVGWKLVPFTTQAMFLKDDASIIHEAEWMKYNTWVIPYKDDQLFPAGFYLNGVDGLPQWAEEDGNIVNTDIVVWHNLGLTHIPRAEDGPVMPVKTVGITLEPENFFLENPALDVPPPPESNAARRRARRSRAYNR